MLPSSFASTFGADGPFISLLVAFASSDAFPVSSFATATTSVPSFTLSSGIVTFPVCGSIVTSEPSGTLQVPFASLVAITVTGLSAPSGVYVISTVLVSASAGGVTSMLPSSFASTFGAAGGVVSAGVFALTVALAVALSVVPSVYFTTTGISTSPAGWSAGATYVTFPVLSSMLAPLGASAPSSYLVTGTVALSTGCPALSLNVGSTVAVSPCFTVISPYSGWYLSAFDSAGVFALTVALAVAVSSVPSSYFTTTGIVTSPAGWFAGAT